MGAGTRCCTLIQVWNLYLYFFYVFVQEWLQVCFLASIIDFQMQSTDDVLHLKNPLCRHHHASITIVYSDDRRSLVLSAITTIFCYSYFFFSSFLKKKKKKKKKS